MKRLKDFSRQQISSIAIEYASTPLMQSHLYYEKKYGISKATFYNILEKAIIESIVNEEIAKNIAKKAEKNSYKKAGKFAAARTKHHQEKLLLQRKEFKFSRKNAKKIAISYSKTRINKEEFCKANLIPTKLFDDALFEAIVQNLIDDKCYERIKNKALQNHSNSSNACEFFIKLDKMRNNHKQMQR